MELERLHVLQDKPFPESKKVIMVNELGIGIYPFTAVIQGIKSLHGEDLRSIKLFLLIEAIRKFVDADKDRFQCGNCHKEGCVIMIDAVGNSFALACTCSNGDMIAELQGLVRWNGKGVQDSNGRILFKSKADSTSYVNEPPPVADEKLEGVLNTFGGTVVNQGERQ